MILFVFEGPDYEVPLYEGIKTLFFPQSKGDVLCAFCSSIYTFYKRLKDEFDGFGDVVDVLKTEMEKIKPDHEIFKYKSSDFESTYLFFDYDFYRDDLDEKNRKVSELLEFFNEETENGKLFISYPMVESIQYTKELPDSQYHTYTVSRKDSMGDLFKPAAKRFCFYRGYKYLKDGNNWKHLIKQNVQKANMLTTDNLAWPESKDDVGQVEVFNAQLEKHVLSNNEVAILNAFPMFLYYYFPKDKFQKE